jgi:16S rRNA (cytidine1402-2'-O)-methyltransferase
VDLTSPHTLIFYESPYRLKDFLEDALVVYGDRQACIANDLTKMFETILRGKISELIQQIGQTEPRGEYTVVIAGQS